MKKILGFIVLSLLLSGNAYAETWTCENQRFGKVMYEIKDTEIVLTFPNSDGRTFNITKDKRQYKISVYGEFSGTVESLCRRRGRRHVGGRRDGSDGLCCDRWLKIGSLF